MRHCPYERGRRRRKTAEDLAKRGGRDGEVREQDPENGALGGLAPPRGPIESVSQQVLQQSGMRIGVEWRPVGVYYRCQDAKMEILVEVRERDNQ